MDFNIDYIRNRIINTATGVVVVLLIPSLAASLSRSLTFGWSPMFSIHILVALSMVVTYAFRKQLKINLKYHLFAASSILMGIAGIYYNGLIGSYVFILLAITISTMGLSRKTTSIYLLLSISCMLLIAWLYVNEKITFDIDLNAYNITSSVWITKAFLITLTGSITLYSISLFNGFFKKAFTEIRQSSAQLTESKNEAENTLASLPIPVMIVNDRMEIVYINEKYKATFSNCIDDGINFTDWVNQLHASAAEDKLVFNSIKDELQKIQNITIETKKYSVGINCSIGTIKYVELSAKRVNDRFLISMVDVTDRINYQNKLLDKEHVLQQQNEQLQTNTEELRQQNEEATTINEELSMSYGQIQSMNLDLQEAKEMAEESDRLKSAFLSNMSHEIRTPMNGIIGFADLLNETELEEDDRKYYTSIISQSSKQLLNIVNDIIDFSKIEAGAIELFNSEMDIYESLNDLKLFFNPTATDKGIGLILAANLREGEGKFITDHTKLKQVLTNLISNAIKFTNTGHVKFGVEKVKKEMQFFVEDTGIGISAEKINIIFERFRKVNEDSPGTGLGLAISKSYIESLGGKLDIKSDKGNGTRFSFNIPILEIDKSKHY